MSGEFAGTLRERVTIETRTGNRDALAGSSGQYAYSGEAWAALAPIVPGDLTQAGSLSAMPRWKVTMRKREGIDPRVRLVWRSKYLAVRQVVSDPREPSQMQITCEEVR
ncbi:head-tail adaptor protein [Sphingorhabdus arenilitoris]|uniref:Head-tail adaptor protein n=1 Tax=Sphingorhabdus arenilitoris TaxID=1490041 RepID=A0ABV8RF23_9SPHN